MNIERIQDSRPDPQERIAKRLGQARETIRNHLAKMPELANQPKADLSRGFTVARVAEKHGWTEPMGKSRDIGDVLHIISC